MNKITKGLLALVSASLLAGAAYGVDVGPCPGGWAATNFRSGCTYRGTTVYSCTATNADRCPITGVRNVGSWCDNFDCLDKVYGVHFYGAGQGCPTAQWNENTCVSSYSTGQTALSTFTPPGDLHWSRANVAFGL